MNPVVTVITWIISNPTHSMVYGFVMGFASGFMIAWGYGKPRGKYKNDD